MKITDDLILEVVDIERILIGYLKSYRYYNKGRMPEKIVFPMPSSIEFQLEIIPPKFVSIPIEFKGEVADVTSGHKRASGDSKASGAVSPSERDKPEPDKKS